MKRFILAFSMFSVWLAIASTYYMCVIKGLCWDENTVTKTPLVTTQKAVSVKEIPVALNIDTSAQKITSNEIKTTIDTLRASGLKIYNSKDLLKVYSNNFKIYKNTSRIQIPFEISEYGYVIAKHMDSVNSSLIIKGYYNQEETVEYGAQRALFIKDRLIQLGIPSNLISTSSDSAFFEYDHNKFTGGILFNFKKSDSVISINSVNYNLLKETNAANVVSSNFTDTSTNSINPVTKIKDPVSITNKPKTVTTVSTKQKPEVIKKEKILFTLTEKNFRNNKFKATKNFKKFLEAHKATNNIQLMGYSNASESVSDNYTKGLKLADLVYNYIQNKGSYSGNISKNALKKQALTTDGTVQEGVTLIIQ